MRVLIVDHMAVLETNRGLYYNMFRCWPDEVTICVPEFCYFNFLADSKIVCEPFGLYEERFKKLRVLVDAAPHRFLYNPVDIVSVMLRRRWDVVILSGEPEWLSNLQFILLGQIFARGARTILTSFRNITFSEIGFPYKFRWLYRAVDFMTRTFSDTIVAYGKTVKDQYEALRHLPRRIVHIPYPINRTVAEEKRRPIRGNGPIRIGFAGRLNFEKGVDMLPSALKGIEACVEVHIAGTGPLSGWLMEQLDHQKIPNKHYGLLSPGMMEMFYREIDVLVVPSRTTRLWKEQFGRVIVEAMSYGVVPIGSDSGEIPFVIKDGGLIFKEGDVGALQKALNSLIEDRALMCTLSNRAIELFNNFFSNLVIIEKLYLLLNVTANEHS